MKPEQIAQCQLFDWIRSRPDIKPYAMHLANERKCSPVEGRLLKRMGVRAGISDILIAIPKGSWHGMWLELKVNDNRPTPSQLEFIDDMTEQGYYSIWTDGYAESRAAIEQYLLLKNI